MLPPQPNPAVYAMSGVERSGASRTGAHSAKLFVQVNGVERAFNRTDTTAKILIDSFTVTERPGGVPCTAAFTAVGFPVGRNEEVIARLGSINNAQRLFAGTVLATSQTLLGTPANVAIGCRLIDYTWQLDFIKVIGRFSGAVDTIVRTLMAQYAPDWSVTLVETGLPTIDEITFTEPVNLTTALNRLTARVPLAWWKGTYDKELIFRVTDLVAVTQPQDLTVGNPLFMLNSFGPVDRDGSQQITRVHMDGGGSEALVAVAPGETILPLTDAPEWWYGDFGGVVVSGPQRISYTARQAGGGGSLVGTGAAPTSAPVLSLAAGSGVDVGDHDVAVVFVTAAGKSLAGPKATITVGVVAAPVTAPTVGTPLSGTGPDAGVHRYAITEVTAAGETTPSPVSADVTTTVVEAPTLTPVPSHNTFMAGHTTWAIGDALEFAVAYVTAGGGVTTIGPISAPFTAVAENPVLNPGYAEFVTVHVPDPSDGSVTSKRVYVRINGAWAGYHAIALGNVIPLMYYPPNAGSPPGTSTALKGIIPLTDLAPASPLGTSRNLYGTAAGDSQLKLVAALNTTDATYNVTTPDSGLGANAPTVNTAAAGQITTSAPLGPASVTAREFYMSLTAGGARKLAHTISNNTAVTGTITASNATLTAAAAEPSSDTSGLAQPSGQVLAGATSIPVAGLGGVNGFQATGGYAVVGNGQTVVRYTGITGNVLTGVPATGDGAITATVQFGSQITAAPALTIGPYIVSQELGPYGSNVTFLRLLTGTTTDRFGQQFQTGVRTSVSQITLFLERQGAVIGNVWVTIQTGAITGAGTVLATSAPLDASTLIAATFYSFTFATPVTLPPGVYYIVLQGDYARSDTVNVAVFGFSTPPASAYKYNGTTVSAATPITAFNYQVIAEPDPILYTIHKGDPVNVWVTVDDYDAQAALSAQLDPTNIRLGAAGIIEDVLQDRRLSRTEAIARARARLIKRVVPTVGLSYQTYDKNTHPWCQVDANISAPTRVHERLRVQDVTLTCQDASPPIFPIRTVQASADLFTFEQLVGKGT